MRTYTDTKTGEELSPANCQAIEANKDLMDAWGATHGIQYAQNATAEEIKAADEACKKIAEAQKILEAAFGLCLDDIVDCDGRCLGLN